MDFTAPLKETALIATPDYAFNMEVVKACFIPYLNQINEMIAQAQAHMIIDAETNKQAVAMAGEAKRLAKKIDAQGSQIIEEPNQFVKSVRSFCKDFVGPLGEIEAELKRKIGAWQYSVELNRREQETRAQEAARELQKQLDAEAKEKGVESVTVITPVIAKQESVVRSETGTSSHIRKAWKAEVIDESQVPRKYCSSDMKLINQAIKMGVREIPGVRIFEEISTVLRT